MEDIINKYTFIAPSCEKVFTLEEVVNKEDDYPYLAKIAKFFIEEPDVEAVTCKMMFHTKDEKTENKIIYVFKKDTPFMWIDKFWNVFPCDDPTNKFYPNVSIEMFLIGATAIINKKDD